MAKKKESVSYQETLDLKEPLSETFTFKVQPSLKAVFKARCDNNPLGPVDYSEQLRRLMAKWIQDTRNGVLYLD
ncbi:MAG: hypothetical protein HKM06_07670 [Spirochaetales bacterium]|nr:hypothetical protein [Spirochaetales bacterium]